MKTVEVQKLKVGDKFVLPSYFDGNHYVYVVTNVRPNVGVDCVCINSGKDFLIGRTLPVVPVKVELVVEEETE